MSNELDRLAADLDSLHDRVGTLESRMNELDSKVDAHHTEVMAMLNRIARDRPSERGVFSGVLHRVSRPGSFLGTAFGLP